MNSLKHLDAMVTHLRASLPGLQAVYLFGSRAQGTAGPASDLDLAVLVAGYADPEKLWQLTGELADIAGCNVDLIDLRAASTVMQYQVIIRGQRCWAAGAEASLFESFVLSEKTALDMARGALLAQIHESGTVYAR